MLDSSMTSNPEYQINDVEQDCGISIVSVMKMLQSQCETAVLLCHMKKLLRSDGQ